MSPPASSEQVAGRLDFAFEDMGEQQLKNIARPVRVYRVVPGADCQRGRSARQPRAALPLPDKPSIAVLPFTNMSGDPEQEYFADGITEDIITELSRSRSLFVIARNSSFAYKGKAADIREVGRELGVRYVLEGSVRKAGNRVRVTAQLIEATTGGHLWAERYDRELADIFAVQDEITASVSRAIHPALERSERERAVRKPADDLDAWESYHRGMWHFSRIEAGDNETARGFFRRAVELDPQFARAVAALALTYLNEITLFRPQRRAVNIPLALESASHAVAIDATEAMGHAALARALWMSGRHAESLVTRGYGGAPGAELASRAWRTGRCQALERPARRGDRTAAVCNASEPVDPLTSLWLRFTARAHYWSGSYGASIAVATQVRQSFPHFRQPYNTLIAALGQAGRVDDAQAVMADGLARFGDAFRALMELPGDLRELRSEDRDHLIDGFRKANVA